jgi:ribonuclease HI
VKINWDASINEKDGHLGVGLVARDEYEAVLGARCLTRSLWVDPQTAEAMTVLYAVQFNMEVSFFDVVFQGDAQAVIKETDSQPLHLSRIGHFIESITLERQQCRKSNFVYVHWSKNGAAHILACEATFGNVNETWLEDIPRNIAHIVTRELIPRS